MMRVNTVEQYKIMQFLEANFAPGVLEIELLCRNKIGITDRVGDSAVFVYENDEVHLENEND